MRAPAKRPVAVGWATVDLDRAAEQLASLLAPGGAYEPVAPSVALGAHCRVGRTIEAAPAPFVILLEPSTEGPLAAALARRGEGWCATWVWADADEETTAPRSAPAARSAPAPRSAPPGPTTPGPLGTERLLRDGQRAGPFRLAVVAITIAP